MIRSSFAMMAAALLCGGLIVKTAAAAPAKAGDSAKGKEVFETSCSMCHSSDTDEKKTGPSLKGLFKRAKLVSGKKITEESVREQIDKGGNGMPSYADMLSAEDKDNLIAYLKTL